MEKIIVRRSTVGWLMVVALGLAIMVNEFIDSNYRINGIACIGFIVFISGVFQLLMTGPRVIIDEEGISGGWMGNVKVPWKRIRRAEYKHQPRGDPVITLILDDNTTRIMILGGVTVSPQRIFSEITAYIREQGADATNAPAPTSEEDDDFE